MYKQSHFLDTEIVNRSSYFCQKDRTEFIIQIERFVIDIWREEWGSFTTTHVFAERSLSKNFYTALIFNFIWLNFHMKILLTYVENKFDVLFSFLKIDSGLFDATIVVDLCVFRTITQIYGNLRNTARVATTYLQKADQIGKWMMKIRHMYMHILFIQRNRLVFPQNFAHGTVGFENDFQRAIVICLR